MEAGEDVCVTVRFAYVMETESQWKSIYQNTSIHDDHHRETAAYEADQHLLLGPSVSRPSSPLASPCASASAAGGGAARAGAASVRLPAWRVFEAVEAAEDKVRYIGGRE